MKKMVLGAVCASVLGLQALPLAAETARTEVRVRNVDGAARLCVDGKPEVPHFVFTWAGVAAPHTVTRDWRRVSCRFVSDFDAPRASAHFRFRREAQPLTMTIRGMRLRDVTVGKTIPLKWHVIPADGVGRVTVASNGTLVAKLNAYDPAKGGDLFALTREFHLERDHAYEYTFEVRSDVETIVKPAVYRVAPSGAHYMVNAPDMNGALRQIELAREAGIRLVACGLPSRWAPPENDAAEFALIDSFMRGVIAVHPDALILTRFFADAPGWWLKKHPEARMRFDDGKGGFKDYEVASPSSRAYRRDLCAWLERLARHLSETFPKNLAGIHVAGQNSGEWFYHDSWGRPLSGYDAGTREAFGRAVPAPEARRRAEIGPFFDPKGDVYAFSRFQNDEMADLVAEMILALRRGLGPDKITMAFYGYAWELSVLQNGTAWHGHLSVDRLIRKCHGELDALCGPLAYVDRAWNGTAATMSAAETMSRNGVLWLDEDDSRTYLYPDYHYNLNRDGLCYTPNDPCRSADCFERNMAKEGMRGNGSWFIDLPACYALDFPEMWARVRDFLPREKDLLASGAVYRPEVALVVDEKSLSALGGDWRGLTRPLLYRGRGDWARTGVPYGQYLLADVLRNPSDAKLTVYQAAWYLTAEERAKLAEARRAGRAGVRVWCRWSGYLTETGLSTAAMQETTGFAFTAEDKMNPQPVCAADEIWARDEKGKPSVVVRKCGAGYDVYVSQERIEPALGLHLAKLAGCHAYLEKPGAAVVWAAGDWTSVYALEDGPIALDFGKGGKLSADLRAGETRLYFQGREYGSPE